MNILVALKPFEVVLDFCYKVVVSKLVEKMHLVICLKEIEHSLGGFF